MDDMDKIANPGPLRPVEALDSIEGKISKHGPASGLPREGIFRDWKKYPYKLTRREKL